MGHTPREVFKRDGLPRYDGYVDKVHTDICSRCGPKPLSEFPRARQDFEKKYQKYNYTASCIECKHENDSEQFLPLSSLDASLESGGSWKCSFFFSLGSATVQGSVLLVEVSAIVCRCCAERDRVRCPSLFRFKYSYLSSSTQGRWLYSGVQFSRSPCRPKELLLPSSALRSKGRGCPYPSWHA